MKKLLIIAVCLSLFSCVPVHAQSGVKKAIDIAKIDISKSDTTKYSVKETATEIFAKAVELMKDSNNVAQAKKQFGIVKEGAKKEMTFWERFWWLIFIPVPFVLSWIRRLIPTNSKYGLMIIGVADWIIKILTIIVELFPNLKKGGGFHA